MRPLGMALAALFLAAAAQAGPGISFEAGTVFGATGRYFASRSEVSAPLWKPYYRLSAAVRTFRYADAFPGTAIEYSGALKRELYHVSVAGRLGSKPPNTEKASYHLAYGEAVMTFYGLTLGPERPELSARVWESDGPAPAAGSLDRTWVTRLRGRFTATNHHFDSPPGYFVLVQNTVQFDASETWRERSTLTLHVGCDQYDKVVHAGTRTTYLQNVDYPGNAFPIRGWPNNYLGFELRQALGGGLSAGLGTTRLSLLHGQLESLTGAQLAWEPSASWKLSVGYNHRRRRGVETREAYALGLSYAW